MSFVNPCILYELNVHCVDDYNCANPSMCDDCGQEVKEDGCECCQIIQNLPDQICDGCGQEVKEDECVCWQIIQNLHNQICDDCGQEVKDDGCACCQIIQDPHNQRCDDCGQEVKEDGCACYEIIPKSRLFEARLNVISNCIICTNNITCEDLQILTCPDECMYHKECINRWFAIRRNHKQSTNCPHCNVPCTTQLQL